MSFFAVLMDFFFPMGPIGEEYGFFYGILCSAALYYGQIKNRSREAANDLAGFFVQKRVISASAWEWTFLIESGDHHEGMESGIASGTYGVYGGSGGLRRGRGEQRFCRR